MILRTKIKQDTNLLPYPLLFQNLIQETTGWAQEKWETIINPYKIPGFNDVLSKLEASVLRRFPHKIQLITSSIGQNHKVTDWHHDGVDRSLVVQLQGEKIWQLHPPLYSQFSDAEGMYRPPVKTQKIVVHHLRAGDVMVLPGGWLHRVTPVSDVSVHLVGSLGCSPDDLSFYGLDAKECHQRDAPRRHLPINKPILKWHNETKYKWLTI